MSIRLLPPLSSVFADGVRLARERFWTLLALAFFPALPLLLVSPFVAQVVISFELGSTTNVEVAQFVNGWTVALAVAGLVLSVVASLAASAGTFIVLSAQRDPGARTAFRMGMRRWLPYVWTQLLVVLAALLVLLPSMIMTILGQQLVGPTDPRPVAVWTFRLLPVLLALPVFVVVSWYAFAPILAARGDTWGVDALRLSHRFVNGLTAHVFGFLVAWVLFELVVSIILNILFPGLTLFQNLVHYLVSTVLGSAYLYALYHAVRRA